MENFDINKATDNERYAYLIQQIVESKLVWMLQASDGMFAMFEDNAGKQYIPVWPNDNSAISFISDDWKDYTATSMNAQEFVGWLDELDRDQITIGAYPKENMQVIPIPPSEMKTHLRDASRKY